MDAQSLAERRLVAALDKHDELVRQVASGQISLSEFIRKYDNFYPAYPLDGHETFPPAELLEQYAARIELHEEIWVSVLSKLTTSSLHKVARAGGKGEDYIDPPRAMELLRDLAAQRLDL